MNANIRRLGMFFLVAFAVMMIDITYWQAIDASNLAARSDNPRVRLQASRVRRGLIWDRNGSILADRVIDSQGVVTRTYSDPSLSQVIGYDSPRYGKSGLEQVYDGYLTGQNVGTSWRSQISQWEHKLVVGDNVTLTIDDRIQRQVAAILPERPAAAIVADPRNGEILAMVSKPGFNSNQINDPAYWSSLLSNPDHPFIDRPVNGYYPPGSTFKVVTMSAALDSGIMTPATPFNGVDATGPLTIDFHTFPAAINNLPAGVGAVDLTHALMYSDNIAFAHVGLALGASRFQDYVHRYGLDQTTPFDIPVSQSHLATPGEIFSQLELASSAFGQGGLHVTPMQMLLAAEAQANGGAIPHPVLVNRVTAPDGSVIKNGQYGTLYTPISTRTAGQMRDAMVQVVEAGSGYQAKIPGVMVAAKTGTAETGPGEQPHSWFVCFAPADHPRIAVVVIVEHGGEGAYVAAPLARQILQAALPLAPRK
ncbi:MAG: penicillin-binding protein 2 [Chloroflexota bacterium]